MEGSGIQGVGVRILEKGCKHHDYHPRTILRTKFYLNRTMIECRKPGSKVKGAEFREGGEGICKKNTNVTNAMPKLIYNLDFIRIGQ